MVVLCLHVSILHGQAHTTPASREAQVTCVIDFEKAPLTSYGFALATLKSLGSARDSITDGIHELEESKNADNPVTLLTGMLRGFKLSTNDLICAKRAVHPFTSKPALHALTADQRDHISLAATSLIAAFDKKITLNDRAQKLLKKQLVGGDTAEFSDQLSTLQVESGEVWNDLIPPVAMSELLLIDQRPTDENGNFIKTSNPDEGYLKRLVMTKAQKQAFLDWMNEHFPELNNGTPQEKIADPAKTAQMYLKVFEGRKCSDE
jgi:hypothetical protein